MEKKPFDHAFPYKDISSVAETFADGIHLITVDGTTARITLSATRSDAPKGNQKMPSGQKVTAARIVLPTPAFLELYNQMEQIISGMEQQGIIVREGGALRTIQ